MAIVSPPPRSSVISCAARRCVSVSVIGWGHLRWYHPQRQRRCPPYSANRRILPQFNTWCKGNHFPRHNQIFSSLFSNYFPAPRSACRYVIATRHPPPLPAVLGWAYLSTPRPSVTAKVISRMASFSLSFPYLPHLSLIFTLQKVKMTLFWHTSS